MAFKGGSDDIRSSLSYKLKRVLQRSGGTVLTTDPYVTVDARLRPLDEVLDRSDLLVIGAPAPRVRRAGHGQASGGHLEPPGRRGRRMKPRVVVVIPAYNEGDRTSRTVLGRLFEAVAAARARSSSWSTHADDATVPYVEKYAVARTHASGAWSTPTSPGRPTPSGSGSTAPSADVVVVTMADGCDDPQQIDQLVRLVERGVVVAAASRYSRGGQQVGGPVLKGLLSRLAGLSLRALARVGTRDATNSFKAYDADFVRHGRHRLGGRVRDRHRAGGQGQAGPAAGGRDAHDLAGPAPGMSNFKLAGWMPQYLRWCRFAFGPSLTVERSISGRQPNRSQDGSNEQGTGHAARPGSSAATSSRSCSTAGTRWSGIDNYSKYGPVAQSYDDHPNYRFIEGDARDVDLMTELLADCDHFIAGAAMIGGHLLLPHLRLRPAGHQRADHRVVVRRRHRRPPGRQARRR